MTAAAQAAPSRAEINRRNAQASTGPRHAKDKIKFNALKHGMRAKTAVLPGEDRSAFNARLDAWMSDLAPRDEVDRFLVTRAVEVSWKLDRIRHVLESRRALVCHADADRLAVEAEEVVAAGRRLFFDPAGPLCLYPHTPTPAGDGPRRVSWSSNPDDPDDPARIVVKLEALTLGCAWLIERWGELREILECGLAWQPHDRLKAVRMLGRQPLDAPDDRRVMLIYLCGWAMDPNDQYGFSDMVNEMGPGERKVFIERLNGREAMSAAPPDEEAARTMLLALIAEEEERLDGILAQHLEREDLEAGAALAFDASPEGERLRRYEAENDRALLRIIETLRKRHREADATAASAGRAATVGSVGPSDPIPADPDVRTPPTSGTAESEHPVGLTHLTDGPFEPPGPDPARTETGPSRDAACMAAAPGDNPVGGFPATDADGHDAQTMTSPPGSPAESRARASSGLLAAVLASFVLFVFAGFSAVFGASPDVVGPAFPPRWHQDAVDRASDVAPLSIHGYSTSAAALRPPSGLSPPAADCR